MKIRTLSPAGRTDLSFVQGQPSKIGTLNWDIPPVRRALGDHRSQQPRGVQKEGAKLGVN